jgi:hypothetical protein
VKVETHEAVKPPAGGHHGKRLYISALYLPWSFSHLALAYDSASVGAKGDRTAASGFEVDNCHAEVVRILQDLNF